MKIATKCKRR